MLTGIFSATQGAPFVDTAEKGGAVKIRTKPIRVSCHVERPVGIELVKAFPYFLLRQGKHQRAAIGPARGDFRHTIHKGFRLRVILQPVHLSVDHYHIPERDRKDFFFLFIVIVRGMVAALHDFSALVPAHLLPPSPLKITAINPELLPIVVLQQICSIIYILSVNLYFVD